MDITQSEPYLAGEFAELRCSITLDDSVDTRVDAEVIWWRNGLALSDTVRVRALSPRLLGGSVYSAVLQFSTLSSTVDSGSYVCLSTVFPTENTGYVANSTVMALTTLSISGKFNF